MPASGFEIMGRGLKRDGLERRFYVTGAVDEGEVFDWLDANIDDYADGYWASDWNADEVEGIVGDYIATVTWGRPTIPVAPAANTVDYKFNFRAPGGHLYQSLSTILYSSASGSNADPAVVAARNFGGAINVVNDDGKDRVEGFNLSPPNEVFTLGYNEGDSVITGAYQDTVADLCGKVNNASFRSKAAGQIMLVRATGGRSSTGVWTIELGFGYIPNATSIPVGDNLTVTAKDGFDLLWPYYGTVKDDDADALVKQPTFAYVERIFERADLETELDLPAQEGLMAKEFPSRIRKGDKLDGLPSAGWNAFVETWEKVNQSQTPGKGSGASRGASRLTAEVFAPGDIAADFPVLALTGPAYTPDHRAGVVYEGLTFDSETPATSTAASRLAVLQGPVLEDESREAVIQGPTWVKVDFTDAGHSFAGPKDGDSTRLASAEQGLPILWREDMPESLPADLWCVVRVGSPEPPASAVGVAQGNHLATAGEVQVAIAADYSVEGLGSTLYAANVHGYPVVQNQPVMLAQGEFPEWEPSTAYLADDMVVYDNGGGRVRWQRNSGGSSGATFDSGDWTELHEANGWMVAWPWHTVAKGTAQGNSNSGNGYANVDVELDIDTPVITVTAANPARVPTTSGDRMTLWVRPAGYAGAAHMVLWAESAVGTGGGGGDGDELVASQSGQTAGFLSAVLVDAPAQTAPWYAVDMVLSGATMYGRVNVPAASNDRLVRGVTTAAVKHSDPTYQMATPVGLADGDTPAGSPITVHAPIASYEAGATTWAARDHTNTRWIDSTPARFTLVKAQTTGAVAYGAHGWTVDNVQLLAGGRLPGTVQGNAALRTYRNNEWVWLIWSDENQRWEDFTPLQFRMISFLSKGAVANGAANFTVDNVVALCGGASPAASSATEVTVYGANKAYADNGPGLAAWNDSAQQFIDITPPAAVVPFDCIIRYGQSLTAGAWNDGTRKWTDGTGTVTLLTDNGDGTYNEGADQAVRWKANVAVSPPSGKAYRGAGLIVDGVYKLENVYTCDGVTWTSGEQLNGDFCVRCVLLLGVVRGRVCGEGHRRGPRRDPRVPLRLESALRLRPGRH